jgi:hypothetical protein
VLEWLAGDMTIDDILADYEDLTREDILSAIAWAARVAQTKRIEPLAASGSSSMPIGQADSALACSPGA